MVKLRNTHGSRSSCRSGTCMVDCDDGATSCRGSMIYRLGTTNHHSDGVMLGVVVHVQRSCAHLASRDDGILCMGK